MDTHPNAKPVINPLLFRVFLYTKDIGTANEQEETIFITNPIVPYSLTENICKIDTHTTPAKAYHEPNARPPMVINISFISNLKNEADGIMGTLTTYKDANASWD